MGNLQAARNGNVAATVAATVAASAPDFSGELDEFSNCQFIGEIIPTEKFEKIQAEICKSELSNEKKMTLLKRYWEIQAENQKMVDKREADKAAAEAAEILRIAKAEAAAVLQTQLDLLDFTKEGIAISTGKTTGKGDRPLAMEYRVFFVRKSTK